MKIAVQALSALAAIFVLAACRHTAPPPKAPPPLVISEVLAPSPRLIVGRIVATDPARGFAFVELASDYPAAAVQADAELTARTLEFVETAQLRASRYLRGRTLGTVIVTGKPSPGDEVVWLAP